MKKTIPKDNLHHIVIIGGGASGLELATNLNKTLVKSKIVKLTLIDKSITYLWKPLLHEAACGTLDVYENEINYILYSYKMNFNFILGNLSRLDRSKKVVYITTNIEENNNLLERSISYDTLVIAVGSLTNDFSIPGVQQHCMFLDSLAQAEHFHKILYHHIIKLMQSDIVNGAKVIVAIIGAGATGVELAAELHYVATQLLKLRYSSNRDLVFKIILIEAAKKILPQLPNRITDKLQKKLVTMGIEIQTQQKIVHVSSSGLTTASNQFIPSTISVWTAGIQAPKVLNQLDGLETNNINQLKVNPTLQTTLDPNIFAIGDCAYCYLPEIETAVPPRAQAAHQQALFLTASLANHIAGRPLLNYEYKDYGSLIKLSHYTTIGLLETVLSKKFVVQGKIAELFYYLLYKKNQISLHGFLSVIVMTLASWMTHKFKSRIKLH